MKPLHSPGGFEVCGDTCWVHPQKRCELVKNHHTNLATIDHKGGGVAWNVRGHRHLSMQEQLADQIRAAGFGSLAGNLGIRFQASDHVPPGHAFLLGGERWHDLIFPSRQGHSESRVIFDEARAFAQQGGGPVEKPDGQQQLTDWWMGKAADEVERTVPKAVEYGSDDLGEIGRQMVAAMDLDPDDFDEADLTELGIYFYVVGKVARWTSAIRRGDKVSDDTLFDIGVYIRMAQRVRHSGGWPGIEENDE